MKIRIYTLVFTAILYAVMLTNCSQEGRSSAKDKGDTLTENITDEPETGMRLYGIRSGIIEYKHSGSTTGTTTIYFDKFGIRSASHTDLVVNGQADKGWIITIDDMQYMYKEGAQQGMKMKNPMIESMKNMTDIEKFSGEMYSKMGFKPAGTEKHLGKTCKVYQGTDGKVLTWNGMLMLMEMNAGGITMKQEATKMDLNAKIKPSIFEIPAGVTFTGMPGFGMGQGM